MIWIKLSINLSLYIADIIPKNMPINIAIVIEETASTSVLGSVSLIISLTFLPCFVNEVLK